MTTPAVDYYALLDLPRKASPADVRAAYKHQQRIWRKRAASTSDSSVSGEATRRLALLAEAFAVLSDVQRRAAYDMQPMSVPVESILTPNPAEIPSDDWIEQAERYLEMGDYYAAAHAAREATATLGNSAEAWSALSRANAGLRRLDDAVYEARRAIDLAPDNPMYHFDMGTIQEELGQWDQALGEYTQASRLAPTVAVFQLAIGGVWLLRNQPDKALPIIERVYVASPNDENACYYEAQALIAMAEAMPKDKSADGYAVTSASEIQRMREYLSRAAAINHLDPETSQNLRDTEAYLQRMEGHTFNVPFGALSAFSAIGEIFTPGEGGCGTELLMLLLAVTLIGLIAFAPLWLVIWGFSLLSTGEPSGLLLLLGGGGLGYVWYLSIWVPRWKVNVRRRDHRVRYQS